uniref:Methyltransferase FkbM domain-containing protein n=1 Tax=viral metagenome TaxID=1070528 RepID=A0A6C0E7C1_9ZZZZ
MSYHSFNTKIKREDIKIIFELGSRDLIDAIALYKHYNCKLYAFECNPDCLSECNKQLQQCNQIARDHITLVDKAVSLIDDEISFFAFDLTKYDNMGASSMFKIDFTTRNTSDPDYNRENPQKEVRVKGTRLDTFMKDNSIPNIDLLCMDLQGYELNALKSLGEHIRNVKYIISETSIQSTYIGGATFAELHAYLSSYGFTYKSSNAFGHRFPDLSLNGFSEFDVLYVNTAAL